MPLQARPCVISKKIIAFAASSTSRDSLLWLEIGLCREAVEQRALAMPSCFYVSYCFMSSTMHCQQWNMCLHRRLEGNGRPRSSAFIAVDYFDVNLARLKMLPEGFGNPSMLLSGGDETEMTPLKGDRKQTLETWLQTAQIWINLQPTNVRVRRCMGHPNDCSFWLRETHAWTKAALQLETWAPHTCEPISMFCARQLCSKLQPANCGFQRYQSQNPINCIPESQSLRKQVHHHARLIVSSHISSL